MAIHAADDTDRLVSVPAIAQRSPGICAGDVADPTAWAIDAMYEEALRLALQGVVERRSSGEVGAA